MENIGLYFLQIVMWSISAALVGIFYYVMYFITSEQFFGPAIGFIFCAYKQIRSIFLRDDPTEWPEYIGE